MANQDRAGKECPSKRGAILLDTTRMLRAFWSRWVVSIGFHYHRRVPEGIHGYYRLLILGPAETARVHWITIVMNMDLRTKWKLMIQMKRMWDGEARRTLSGHQ